MSGTPAVSEIIDVLEKTMEYSLSTEDVPAATEKECGQAILHDLEGTKARMRKWLAEDKENLKQVF